MASGENMGGCVESAETELFSHGMESTAKLCGKRVVNLAEKVVLRSRRYSPNKWFKSTRIMFAQGLQDPLVKLPSGSNRLVCNPCNHDS